MSIKADSLNHYFGETDLYNDLDIKKVAEALSGSVRFATVANPNQSLIDRKPFLGLHAYLEKTFPEVHKTFEKTIINEMSLLYYWPGSDASLRPALFMGHLDVVPVAPGTEQDWDHEPYSGDIADDFVWGRGSADCKSMVIGVLSAAEYLISKGHTPKRGIYLAFGHDEEVLGVNGAGEIAKHLESKGVKLEFVQDEGGGFMMGDDFGAPGQLLAKVDLFEKGYADVAVNCYSAGGHSSRPGSGTALGTVAKAIVALEANQFQPEMNSVVVAMCKALAPYATQEPFKTLMADPEGHQKELMDFLLSDYKLAPMLHTTTACNMITGSPAPNVLPQKVECVVNFRLAPQDNLDDVLKHCKDLTEGLDLDIHLMKGRNPSGIARSESYAMDVFKEAIGIFFPTAVTIPGLIMGGTDACYYEDLSDCCYRFRPYIDGMILGHTVHGTNERQGLPALEQGVKAVIHIMKTTCMA